MGGDELSHKKRTKRPGIPTMLWAVLADSTVTAYLCIVLFCFLATGQSHTSSEKTLTSHSWDKPPLCVPSFTLLPPLSCNFTSSRKVSQTPIPNTWFDENQKRKRRERFFCSGRCQMEQIQQVVTGKSHLNAIFAPIKAASAEQKVKLPSLLRSLKMDWCSEPADLCPHTKRVCSTNERADLVSHLDSPPSVSCCTYTHHRSRHLGPGSPCLWTRHFQADVSLFPLLLHCQQEMKGWSLSYPPLITPQEDKLLLT